MCWIYYEILYYIFFWKSRYTWVNLETNVSWNGQDWKVVLEIGQNGFWMTAIGTWHQKEHFFVEMLVVQGKNTVLF